MSRVSARWGHEQAGLLALPQARAAGAIGSGLAAHWLAAVNVLLLVVLALAVVAPALMAVGWHDPAELIYQLYAPICHQWPARSFFLFGPQPTYSLAELAAQAGPQHVFTFVGSPDLGYKLAFCQRDLALYGAIWLSGLAYAARRSAVRPLPLSCYLLLCVPIGLDGFSQLLGWRESTWALRVLTGTLFGSASVWFLYPRLDRALSGRRLPGPGAEARA